ncbi:hypothetical protein BPOR_0127g00070 [Botrytis porri]|uniref:Cytochrome P450 n=1 Tax=Botrytis porri TaxID=87229 RepID=A0A4Z1KX32_9HELO|nr:hypothetical protein BPOR_0127g00070 [Botrytis porri]
MSQSSTQIMELNRSTLSCIVVSIIALHLISKLVQGRREEEILQKRDCSRPRHYSHKDPVWGIGLFVGIVESISNGNNFAFFQSLFDKYGKAFEVNSWGQKAIYTIDAENIHTILVKSQKKFIVEPSSLHATECFLGRGIFNTDGSSWKQAHLASKPIFARAQIPILDILEEHMDTLLAMIPHDGTTVDLLPRLKRLFLDTSTALIFGDSINILKSEKGQIDTEKFLAAFDTVLQGIGLRVALGKFASAKPRQVLEEGSHIFFNLARNPEVWNRLQNEISNYDGPLIYDSLKQMRYANAIVDESLRILAPSGRSIRSCGEDRILRTGGGPNGKDLILVIRGTEVNYIFRSMHLDKDIWGAEADEYRPERWESLGKAQLRAYIPFSEGD